MAITTLPQDEPGCVINKVNNHVYVFRGFRRYLPGSGLMQAPFGLDPFILALIGVPRQRDER
jgi:hypothetical protein